MKVDDTERVADMMQISSEIDGAMERVMGAWADGEIEWSRVWSW